MTSALYLEHFLDSLEHLPVELQRNFKLMQELDTRAQSVMRQIDAMADEFMGNVKSMSSDRKKEPHHSSVYQLLDNGQGVSTSSTINSVTVMTKIQVHFNKAKEYGDDKVQLAIQTYELVDKHIRRLDSDLARFESEIQDKALTSSRAQEEPVATQQKRGRKKLKEKEKKKKGASEEDEAVAKTAKKKKKIGGKVDKTGVDKAPGGLSSSDSPIPVLPLPGSEVLDMPVDPNEPTYCLCHQVSYGEMIGCDNPDCPIEWFHFACVSLTTKPKGKWFCPKCSADRKKK